MCERSWLSIKCVAVAVEELLEAPYNDTGAP